MTRNEYDNFLARANISQVDIKKLLERVLTQEEDILEYIKHIRAFCREHDLRASNDKELVSQFMRGLLSAIISWRVRNRYSGAETVFNEHLPVPSRDSIHESWRHKDNQEREFRYRSDKRRGFYRDGEPTVDCGEDLKKWLYIYEYQAKGKTPRT